VFFFTQYKIFESSDGINGGKMLVDKKCNKTDVPHDYIELPAPVETRFLNLSNIHMPTGKIQHQRIPGLCTGHGEKPGEVDRICCSED